MPFIRTMLTSSDCHLPVCGTEKKKRSMSPTLQLHRQSKRVLLSASADSHLVKHESRRKRGVLKNIHLLQPKLQSSAAGIVAPMVKANINGSLPARGMVRIPESLTTTTTTTKKSWRKTGILILKRELTARKIDWDFYTFTFVSKYDANLGVVICVCKWFLLLIIYSCIFKYNT